MGERPDERLPRQGTVLLRGGLVVTIDALRRVFAGDLLVSGGRIAAIGPRLSTPRSARILDCRGRAVLPGLVQAHVHLCQTLFRNHADGLPLLPWLARRIWPLEAAHDPRSLGLSARLGIAELLLGGTTTILDMGTVRHSDALFEAALASGIRYVGGKAMMDAASPVPAALDEDTDESLSETARLGRRWHGAADGRLRYAICPRFALSCSERLLRAAAEMSAREGWLVHSHASETAAEAAAVRRRAGVGNVEYFHRLGLAGRRVVLAHCVHLERGEPGILARTGTSAVHCPGSNLKLASGVAPLPELLARGVNVALGADGAACNNVLDAFMEMRLAATLHLPRRGAAAVDPAEVLAMATARGARALGIDAEVGSIEEGKRADLAILDLRAPHLAPRGEDLHGTIVYAARASDVTDVFVDGRWLVRARRLVTLDAAEAARDAPAELRRVLRRARVPV